MADWDTSHLFLDDEDELENELYAVEGEKSKDILIFLVDVGRNMFLEFDEEDAGKTYFDIVMNCISEDLKARIISRDSDKVGVCFYNTREKKNQLESEGVYILRDVEELSAGFIKDVSSMKDRFANEIGSQRGVRYGSRESALYNALWVAQGMFSKTATKNHGKRVLLFTNNDDPFEDVDPSSKADLKRTTIQRAKDANDLGISIELFPMSRPGEEFNVNIFYKEIIQLDDDEPSQFLCRSKQRFTDLVQQMKKKIMKKRTIRKLMLTLPTGQSIGLRSYAMLRPTIPAKSEWLDSSTNTPLKIERSFICSDTGAIVNEPVQRFQEYNNKKVVMTTNEIAQVKNVTDKQLQLLGFKPIKCLKDYHNLRPPTFLYPDDETINGSTCAFVALHRALLRFHKYAVAFHGQSANSQMVALVPQEEVTVDGFQIHPPGLQMIYLPYADDIRPAEKFNICKNAAMRATSEQVEKAMTMINKLHLKDFTVDQISNPALQRHYAILQAVALDEEDLPESRDETLPDEEGMQRPQVVAAVKAFKDSVYGENHDAEEAEVAAHRAKGSITAQKRKAATEVAALEADKYDWDELAESGKLKELTVTELKYFLNSRKLPLTGKKDILISRILSSLGK